MSGEQGFDIGGVRIPTRVLMAPMAGLTNAPFRRLAAVAGCRAFWTEMITAEGLVRRRPEIISMLPGREEEHPLAVQLFGAEAGALAEAGRMCRDAGADIVDINMACPVKRISRLGAGAALMRDPLRAENIVRAVSRSAGVPVTVKMRAGWDSTELNALEVAKAVIAGGAAAVICHGRTRAQGFRGRADHGQAGLLAGALTVPVIISGDITTGKGASRALRETGAAAVMIGRASVGDPWIFARLEKYLRTGEEEAVPPAAERAGLMLKHLDLLEEAFGGRRAAALFRPHLVAYLRGRPGASRLRQELLKERLAAGLREKLAALFTTDWE